MELALSIVSLIFCTLAFIFSVWNFIENRAAKLSTHQVQFVPADSIKTDENGFEELTDESRLKLENDDLDFDYLYDDGTPEALRPNKLKKKSIYM